MAKKGGISLFETQKKDKPKPEELCSRFLTDDNLNNGMRHLLAFCNELKMKPIWYATNSFKCSYKGKSVVSFGIGRGGREEENWVTITVYIADRDQINNFLSVQSDKTKHEYIQSLKLCTRCASCAPGFNVEVLGTFYNLCFKGHNIVFFKPTESQFEILEKFIVLRREYIKNFQKQPICVGK